MSSAPATRADSATSLQRASACSSRPAAISATSPAASPLGSSSGSASAASACAAPSAPGARATSIHARDRGAVRRPRRDRVEAAEPPHERQVEHRHRRELALEPPHDPVVAAGREPGLERRARVREVALREQRAAELQRDLAALGRLGQRERLAQDGQAVRAFGGDERAGELAQQPDELRARHLLLGGARRRNVAATSGAPRAHAARAAARSASTAHTRRRARRP